MTVNPLQILADIKKTVKQIIQIKAKAIEGDYYQNLNIWDSKFGGLPYIPKGMQYPTNDRGEPLYLLAQINFFDAPILYPFPKTGLLQFYIDTDEHNGRKYKDYDDRSGFKILHIPHPDSFDNQTDLSFVKDFLEKKADQDYLPITKTHRLSFDLSYEAMPSDYPVFEQTFEQYVGLKIDNEHFHHLYDDLMEMHLTDFQIGGYARPFYSWPEAVEGKENDYELLLRIKSTFDNNICFGNGEVVNFIIHKEDLKNLDFSKVIYFM